MIDMGLLSVIRRRHFREGMPIREIERHRFVAQHDPQVSTQRDGILNILHRLTDGKPTGVAVIDASQALSLRRDTNRFLKTCARSRPGSKLVEIARAGLQWKVSRADGSSCA